MHIFLDIIRKEGQQLTEYTLLFRELLFDIVMKMCFIHIVALLIHKAITGDYSWGGTQTIHLGLWHIHPTLTCIQVPTAIATSHHKQIQEPLTSD